MTELELKNIVQARLVTSLGYQGGLLTQERLLSERYYKGEPFGDEVDGKSKVVSRDVAESIDSMLPPLLKPFTNIDEIVKFDPIYKPPKPGETPRQAAKRSEDEAKLASDRVNYEFFKRNKGFLILHDWVKDGLMKKLGVVKVWWDDSVDIAPETYTGLSDQELQMLEMDPDVKIVDKQSRPDGSVPLALNVVNMVQGGSPLMVHDVVCHRTVDNSGVKVAVVPPEEFLIDHRTTSLDDSRFLCHRSKRSMSELKEMGFDPDVVDDLPGNDAAGDFNQERIERFRDEDAYPFRYDVPGDPSTREVWVNECYVRIDFDGDGLAELRQVWLAGDTSSVVLSNEEVDGHPFVSFSPIPMPHKTIGLSIVDQTADIQLIKSTLLRGALDSMYLSNEPMIGAIEGQVNLDDLLNRRAGGIVRLKSADALSPIPSVNVSQDAYTMINYMDSVRETRTGVRRFSSSLNADSLDAYNATATGAKLQDDAANDRLQLIARVFAETSIKPLSKRILELICKHSSKPQVIRMAGQFIEMDPREWSTLMDVTVNVGLGTGNRDERLQKLMALAPIYTQLVQLQQGIAGPLVTAENLYSWLIEVVKSADLPMPELYFVDPSQNPNPQAAQQPKPDPKMAAEQAKTQAQLALMQAKAAQDQKTQQERAAIDIQIDKIKTQHEMEQEALRARHDMELNRQKMENQIQLDSARQAHDQEMERQKLRQEAPKRLTGLNLIKDAHGNVLAAHRHYDDGTMEEIPMARTHIGT